MTLKRGNALQAKSPLTTELRVKEVKVVARPHVMWPTEGHSCMHPWSLGQGDSF